VRYPRPARARRATHRLLQPVPNLQTFFYRSRKRTKPRLCGKYEIYDSRHSSDHEPGNSLSKWNVQDRKTLFHQCLLQVDGQSTESIACWLQSSFPRRRTVHTPLQVTHIEMRLLYFTGDEELSFTADMFNDSNIPPYAIISHTWGDEEVHYDDIINKRGMTKAGYAKILFCARQAAADGLQYCWVDSCCINKSDYSEHSEAINSMFRWYQNAERCYFYLVDVSSDGRDGTSD
jgi:hypothetical protein